MVASEPGCDVAGPFSFPFWCSRSLPRRPAPRCQPGRLPRRARGALRDPAGAARAGRHTRRAPVGVAIEVHRRRAAGWPSLGTIVALAGEAGEGTTAHREALLRLFRLLTARRDLVLVDRRGTGRSSAVRCAANASRACAGRLGERATLLGSGAAARDLLTVLDELAIPRADLYAAGYATVTAQAFAARHPDRLRSLVLDAATVAGGDPVATPLGRRLPPHRRAPSARPARTAARRKATLRRGSAAWQVRLARGPVAGLTHRSVGCPLPSETSTPTCCASSTPRSGPSGAGDRKPLARLAAAAKDAAAARIDGAGHATPCLDRPLPWGALAGGSIAPFRAADWGASGLVGKRACAAWPQPAVPDPLLPETAAPVAVPSLVLIGELDGRAPQEEVEALPSRFTAGTFVTVPATGHVAALDSTTTPARASSRAPGSAACAPGRRRACAGFPPVRALGSFPRRAADSGPAKKWRSTDRSTLLDRRVAATAARTVVDAVLHWPGAGTHTIRALRGGTVQVRGDERVTLLFQGARFADDLQVFGGGSWNRATDRVDADLVFLGGGVEPGALHVSWSLRDRKPAQLFGTIGRRDLRLLLEAP